MKRAVLARSLGGVCLSVVLIRLAFPPFDLGPLIVVAWVPFLFALRGVRFRLALALGALHGFALGLLAHGWVISAVTTHLSIPSWQAALALVAIAALCGLRSALVAAGLELAARGATPVWLSFPVLLACAELLVPGFFPWTNALAVHQLPVAEQLASLGGATLVSAWLSLLNALLTDALWRVQAARRLGVALRPAAALVGSALAVVAFGAVRVTHEAQRAVAAPQLHIAIAHFASGHDDAPDMVPELRRISIAHEQRTTALDLVLWPEGVSPMPVALADVATTARNYWLRDRLQPPSAPRLISRLLLGAALDAAGGLQNSALLLDRGGTPLGSYSKRQLVPIGETGVLPDSVASGPLAHGVTAFQSGAGETSESESILSVDGHPLAVSICFEDILSETVRSEVLRTNAELLVNLTSDRWFQGTSAVAFHFALAKLRAIEQGKYLLRATRDGVSAIVDSSGGSVLLASGGPSRILDARVPCLMGVTFYAQFAAWLRGAWLLAGALLLLWAWCRRSACL